MSLISLKDAAKIVVKNEDAIRFLVSEGRIKGKEVKGSLMIDRESLIFHYWSKAHMIASDMLRDYHNV
tara:strand:+ start:634 stop:837 length:204 start_codon:yes stop_codon:yes gene_type:complete